jgi:hypothetical protein
MASLTSIGKPLRLGSELCKTRCRSRLWKRAAGMTRRLSRYGRYCRCRCKYTFNRGKNAATCS